MAGKEKLCFVWQQLQNFLDLQIYCQSWVWLDSFHGRLHRKIHGCNFYCGTLKVQVKRTRDKTSKVSQALKVSNYCLLHIVEQCLQTEAKKTLLWNCMYVAGGATQWANKCNPMHELLHAAIRKASASGSKHIDAVEACRCCASMYTLQPCRCCASMQMLCEHEIARETDYSKTLFDWGSMCWPSLYSCYGTCWPSM